MKVDFLHGAPAAVNEAEAVHDLLLRRVGAKVSANQGLNIKEAAAWLGVDRRTLPRHLVEVPPGLPLPRLTAGQVPARRVGTVLRVFPSDVLGAQRGAPGCAAEPPAERSQAAEGATSVGGRLAALVRSYEPERHVPPPTPDEGR